MSSWKRDDEGFTGLEAAIVLIAFVVVAAMFSYVVLGAGFFTTQKSQEVVHTGVQQASSTLEIVGNVYGTGAPGQITHVNFSVALAPGGTAVDMEKVVITYSNASKLETLAPIGNWQNSAVSAGSWGIIAIQNPTSGSWGTANNLLEKGEQFTISVAPTGGLYKNDQFTIEIKPSVGAALGIHRTAPPSLDTVNLLY
jgi:flagellin FlaB